MKKKLKNFLMAKNPEALCWILALKEGVGIFKLKNRSIDEIVLSLPYVVQDGPFRGMKYTCNSIWSSKYPKLVGSYEFELQPIIHYLLKKKFDRVINVGSAEGYYAVGWAMMCKSSTIIAVDPLATAQRELLSLAKQNYVQNRISIYTWVSTRRLSHWIQGKTLILMDCEGSEIGYLNPGQCKKLINSDILVEIHDFDDHPNIGKQLVKRFILTHRISFIYQEQRNHSDFPTISEYDSNTQNYLLDEQRPNSVYWIYFESKSSP